jgi:porin
MKRASILIMIALAALSLVQAAPAQSVLPATSAAVPAVTTSSLPEATETPVELRPFQMILPTGHLLGDWAGQRTQFERLGITPTLTLETDAAANPVGGRAEGVTEASNLGLGLLFDLDKLAGLKDASFLVQMSERFGNSLSADDIGNTFTTQQVFGGETFRVVDVAWQQKLFDNRVQFRIGRIATGDDFLVCPYDYLFMQNGFDGNPVGIFLDSPGMSAYPSATWGAMLKARPTQRTYVMLGAYNGDSSIRSNTHHGVDLSLNGPVFMIGEAGLRINGLPGDKGLYGNYKIGCWFDNSTATEFGSRAIQRGSSGAYGLFDQVLLPFGAAGSKRGFGTFGSVLFSNDPSVAQLPFFFTGGFAALGVFPDRPTDSCGLGIVYGAFSHDLQVAEQQQQRLNATTAVQKHELALELTYRFSLQNNSVFLQPDLQYIVHPGGSTRYSDALVLGCQLGINF